MTANNIKNSLRHLLTTVLFMSCFLTLGRAEEPKSPPAKTATIVLYRKPNLLLGVGVKMTVYINDEKVGTIANGAREKFTFKLINGKNSIFVANEQKVDLRVESKTQVFEPDPDHTYRFSCQYVFGSPGMDLTREAD